MACLQVCEGVEVTAYYAGHVLGAAMLHVRVGGESVVYTGGWSVLTAVDVQPRTNRTGCGTAGSTTQTPLTLTGFCPPVEGQSSRD